MLLQIRALHIDYLVILICLLLGKSNANYLNGRSRDYAGESSSAGKDVGTVAVGEVFVPKTFPLGSQEPTCEELRAMWIFSKRQSRAAEITNEIPTYRDPFTYNVWEPLYSNSRMLGSFRMGARERARSPVFGRVVSREPVMPSRVSFEHRQRLVDPAGPTNPGLASSNQARLYGSETRPQNGLTVSSSARRASKNRYMGVPAANMQGSGGNTGGNQNSVAVQGSFQKLKELIWTERAKELTQQRRDEEMAARVAVLKEIANGQNIQPAYKSQPTFNTQSDSILVDDENRSPDGSGHDYADIGRARKPIPSEQMPNNKNVNSQNNVRASTRRIGHSLAAHNSGGKQIPKEGIFSSNSGRSARIRIPATEEYSGDLLEKDQDQTVIGIPRTYPIRQSHFRERNRSLFKQFSPSNQFQRNTRGQPTSVDEPASQSQNVKTKYYVHQRPPLPIENRLIPSNLFYFKNFNGLGLANADFEQSPVPLMSSDREQDPKTDHYGVDVELQDDHEY
ncbi:uncharacterized protein Dwil_GK13621, isoform B [Drosophila willistoni]|uniref:Uncharacterized protein, isoform A n=1 Tax=Drosophila willistoni TaxID=7260 RepID=B4NHH6_DROWI|nr:uncharacterized protein LOC6651329 isoform X2 [Drosophila willistoni]EDW83545.2 uncharacterized protein Dwil_GK13621, isoform A [Drosophila willistoni]KRF99805.1 uncharacterized protein Dwil_GK13621, isoform B [Drosophila willistoni]